MNRKINMKYLYLFLPFILSGCYQQVANNIDIQKSIDFCKGAQYIDNIKITAFGGEIVTCVDGSQTNTDSYKLKTN